MAKHKPSERELAEDYFEQLNRDRPSGERIDPRYSNTRIQYKDGHYHRLLKRNDEIPEDPFSRASFHLIKGLKWFNYFVFGGIVVAAIYFSITGIFKLKGEGPFWAILVVGAILAGFIAVAVWDGTRPAKKDSDDDDNDS